MEVSYLVALVGGVLALLSPCAALLLPAFFAYAFSSPGKLLARTGVFYLGLITTLIPLGVGMAGLGKVLTQHRDTLIAVAGWVIVAMGVAAVLGSGFDIARLFRRNQSGGQKKQTAFTTFVLGMVSGVAGVCTGPILGAVLTVAAFSPSPLDGGLLLAVYGLGMTVPLLILALAWEKIGTRRINKLRGRHFTVGKLELHSVSLITGVVLIALGIGFVVTNGFASLEIVSAGTGAQMQSSVMDWFNAIPDVAVIIALALIALGGWFWWWQRKGKQGHGHEVAQEQHESGPAPEASRTDARE